MEYKNGTTCPNDELCVDGAKCLGWGCSTKVCVCYTGRTPADSSGRCAAYKHNATCKEEKYCVKGAACSSTTKTCMCQEGAYGNGRCKGAWTRYNVTLTGGTLLIDGKKAYNLSCTFQDGIPFLNYVSLDTSEVKLLAAKCDVDQGRAKLLTRLEKATVHSFKGSLKERHINLVVSDLKMEHVGNYYCYVGHSNTTTGDSIKIENEDTVDYDLLHLEIYYITRPMRVANTLLMEMNISCAFVELEGRTSINCAELCKASESESGSFRDVSLIWASVHAFRGQALEQNLNHDNSTVSVKNARGSLKEFFIGGSVYFNANNAREYECEVCYESPSGYPYKNCVKRRRYIEIKLEEPLDSSNDHVTGKTMQSSNAPWVGDHGRPAFRNAAVLLCSVIGLFVANRISSFVGP